MIQLMKYRSQIIMINPKVIRNNKITQRTMLTRYFKILSPNLDLNLELLPYPTKSNFFGTKYSYVMFF